MHLLRQERLSHGQHLTRQHDHRGGAVADLGYRGGRVRGDSTSTNTTASISTARMITRVVQLEVKSGVVTELIWCHLLLDVAQCKGSVMWPHYVGLCGNDSHLGVMLMD